MIALEPIGFVRHQAASVPRHWSVSDVEGRLEIAPRYAPGLADIRTGQRIAVLFHFDRSPAFTPDALTQRPPHRDRALGVFSICSPIRPNPLGLSVLEVLRVEDHTVHVRGLDMYDQTPVLDIKPHIEVARECPSYADEADGQ
jgi:tRNA-Thr(GGU) m(6)t(6)A37 methyltransferase TsaA